jgi:hypothetical protein
MSNMAADKVSVGGGEDGRDYPEAVDLPEISDETLLDSLQRTRPFTIVILKAGPKYVPPRPDRDESVSSIIWQHGKRNFALREAGVMPIVCPIADGSGVVGVSIFTAGPEEVDRIMARDPGVQAGLFTYEIHPTQTFPGSSLPM